MRDAASEPDTQIKTTHAELEQFERRAATVLRSTIALALALNAVLIVAIF